MPGTFVPRFRPAALLGLGALVGALLGAAYTALLALVGWWGPDFFASSLHMLVAVVVGVVLGAACGLAVAGLGIALRRSGRTGRSTLGVRVGQFIVVAALLALVAEVMAPGNLGGPTVLVHIAFAVAVSAAATWGTWSVRSTSPA